MINKINKKSKEEIIKEIMLRDDINAKNSMGCNENWYNPNFAIRQTFSEDELKKMPLKHLNNLIELADQISDGLY